jgi:universal stress protein E
MAPIRRILVAVNPLPGRVSPAVLKAAQIARACGAQIELFHALASPLYTDVSGFADRRLESLEGELRQMALNRLEAVADRLRLHSIKVSYSTEWDFPVYEAIIRRAVRIKADLIVASRQSGRHIAPWLLRLTDWELVRWSPIPVLLVKNPHAYRRPAVLAAIDPTHAFSKPLALDKEILSTAGMLSRTLAGTLHAVHVYARIPTDAVALLGREPQALRRVEHQARQSAKKQFDRALRSSHIAQAHRYLIGQHPINGIVEATQESRAAILVMGAISRTGFKRLLIGNTAERVLDQLGCDILVVKPAKFRNRVPTGVRGLQLRLDGVMGYH